MIRLIIAGGRDFKNYVLLKEKVDEFIDGQEGVTIVSGKEPHGADKLGEDYAIERGLTVVEYRPNWKKFGRAAGPIRNKEMAQNADALVVFWDGESRGSESMIKYAKQYNLDYVIVRYDKVTQQLLPDVV